MTTVLTRAGYRRGAVAASLQHLVKAARILFALLISGGLLMSSGCVTSYVVEQAEGQHGNDPESALYALTPLTVPADVALTPFYLGAGIGSLIFTGHLPY